MENRHKARELAFKALYSWELNKSTTFSDILLLEKSLNKEEIKSDFAESIFNGVKNNVTTIDDILSNNMDNWDLERINKVDLSILRLSVYSLYCFKDIADVITINEGINLSKEFGSDNSYKFINGILDSLVIDLGVVLLK